MDAARTWGEIIEKVDKKKRVESKTGEMWAEARQKVEEEEGRETKRGECWREARKKRAEEMIRKTKLEVWGGILGALARDLATWSDE